MSVQTCVGCSTRYATGLDACPHCGSTEYEQEGALVSTRRLPLLVSVSCAGCGRGPWQLRLPLVMTGLVQIPVLHCASCGRQVQIPWPPAEEDMPKITVHGGATNAREQAESSPDAPASQPLAGAEADQGRPTSAETPEVEEQEALSGEVPAPLPEPDVDPYAGKTLAELREEADSRGVASYGTKAQVADRLRTADEAAKSDTE